MGRTAEPPPTFLRQAVTEVTLHIRSSPGLVSHPKETEVWAVRSEAGWTLYARRRSIENRIHRWSSWNRTSLSLTSGESARRASAVTPAFGLGPRFVLATVPLARGGNTTSFDGPRTYYELRANGKEWGGVQVSWLLGAPAELRSILMGAAFKEPRYVQPDME